MAYAGRNAGAAHHRTAGLSSEDIRLCQQRRAATTMQVNMKGTVTV
jgi:hypothetical protein